MTHESKMTRLQALTWLRNKLAVREAHGMTLGNKGEVMRVCIEALEEADNRKTPTN